MRPQARPLRRRQGWLTDLVVSQSTVTPRCRNSEVSVETYITMKRAALVRHLASIDKVLDVMSRGEPLRDELCLQYVLLCEVLERSPARSPKRIGSAT